MEANTPTELVFSPQVPFSWTRRWALAHRAHGARMERRAYRIAGTAWSGGELSAAADFARKHGARLELA
jgi:hypothetical protein